ncbi:unnamed protein product [Urochloa humidicola]
MLDKEERARMLPTSSSQKITLRAAMQEERAAMVSRRLLSKDPSSVSNPSFRVYYGVASAGSVPFLWESAPGTPKNSVSDTTLPPLTPPPSYYSSNNKSGGAKSKFSKSQSSKKLPSSSKPASFVQSILPKLRRSHTMPSRSPSATPPPPSKECNRSRSRLLASPRSSFSSNSRGDDEDDGGAAASPTSTLCFRTRHSGRRG